MFLRFEKSYLNSVKNRIKQFLLEQPHKDGDRLPSIRDIIKICRTSSGTVQSALKELTDEEKICKIHGKGCFWGKTLAKSVIPMVRETVAERLSNAFDQDFEKGVITPSKPLPQSKELAVRYNVSLNTLRKFLDGKVSIGILKKSGRQYFFSRNRIVNDSNPLSELIFVTRCNSWGGFTPESERELDFLRLVYKKAGANRYKLTLLGINDETGKIVDRSGNERRLSDFPNAVGAILSTLLVQRFQPLLNFFAGAKFPVAVWWEHPEDVAPKTFLRKLNWTFFNSTFGEKPGQETGRYLMSQGVKEINYFSPYHNSSWSKDRLIGLETSGLQVHSYVDDEFASPWDYKEIARKKVEKHSVETFARTLEKEKLTNLAKQALAERQGKPNIPWVCVNDEVASILMEMVEEQPMGFVPPEVGPTLIAFDNSIESYLMRLPSYDFNTEALVEQIFYSLSCPSDYYNKKKIHHILGNVVEK